MGNAKLTFTEKALTHVEARRQNGNVCVYRSRSLPEAGNDGFANDRSGAREFAEGHRLIQQSGNNYLTQTNIRIERRYLFPTTILDTPRIEAIRHQHAPMMREIPKRYVLSDSRPELDREIPKE